MGTSNISNLSEYKWVASALRGNTNIAKIGNLNTNKINQLFGSNLDPRTATPDQMAEVVVNYFSDSRNYANVFEN